MRRSRQFLCCALIAVWPVVTSAAQSRPVKSDQQILIELERAWNEAFYKKDLAFIESVLAEEFVATYDDGSRGDKKRELTLVAEFNQQVESSVQEDFVVKVFRDSAVVWFTLRVVGIRKGERAEVKLSYTDVWIFRNGKWQCVSTQSTRLTAK
jgi:hypothetical protein